MFQAKKLLRLSSCAVIALTLAGCASTYTPVVDPQQTDMTRYQKDLAECRTLAEQIPAAENAATDAVIGGGVGAALGAALGAISGNPATGAATGAAIGGFGGGGAGALNSMDRQKKIINNCLTGRGYRILG